MYKHLIVATTLNVVLALLCPTLFAQWNNPSGTLWTSNQVGIGTNSPTAPLEVKPAATLGNTVGSVSEISRFGAYTSGASPNYMMLKFMLVRYANGTDWQGVTPRLQCVTDVTNQSYIDFNPPLNPSGLAFGSGGTQLMTILQNGRVGIGNPNPGVALSVVTNYSADALEVKYNDNGFVRLHANSLPGGGWNPLTKTNDAGIIYGGTTNDVAPGFVLAPWISTGGGMHLDGNGRVGIFTNDTKGYELAVNGQAIFNRVVVKPYASWPDYVFDSAYRLRPIEEVHQYIRTNHHLPEIPTADSVAKSGIDVGANQASLLKKIEELTLYVIDLQQQVNELKKKEQHD